MANIKTDLELEHEKLGVALAMERWGGSFVKKLGVLIIAAHPINLQKIYDTWPEYWDKYWEDYKTHKDEFSEGGD